MNSETTGNIPGTPNENIHIPNTLIAASYEDPHLYTKSTNPNSEVDAPQYNIYNNVNNTLPNVVLKFFLTGKIGVALS